MTEQNLFDSRRTPDAQPLAHPPGTQPPAPGAQPEAPAGQGHPQSGQSHPPVPGGSDLCEAFATAARDVQRRRKDLAGLERMCRRLAAADLWARPARCREVLDALGDWIGSHGAPPRWPADLVSRAQEAGRRLDHDLYRRAVAELDHRSRTGGVPFQCLSRQALEYQLGILTLAFDPPAGRVLLSYAREPAGACALDSETIWKQARRTSEELQRGFRDPRHFFQEILAAYRGILAEGGKPFGERVALADLPGRLTARRASRAAWTLPLPRGFRPVTRAMLAFGLDQLIQNRALTQDGLRLRLGSATMDTTRNKADVIYLARGQAGGQYYLTIWFERETSQAQEG